MLTLEPVEVTGHRGPVRSLMLREHDRSDHLAVVLPGLAYTCEMPLLYYPSLLLAGAGAHVLWVNYDLFRQPGFAALPAAEQRAWLLGDTDAALAATRAPYRRLTLVGKSLGTLAMAHLLADDAALAAARSVWLTPLLSDPQLGSELERAGERAALVIGTADPAYDPGRVRHLEQAAGVTTIVVDGADHGMMLAGDLVGSVRTLATTMERLAAFLTRTLPDGA